MTQPSAKDKIQAWLDNPTTPYDAWIHLTYDEIATQAGVGKSSVDRHLVLCVARSRGYAVEDVKRQRKTALHERVGRMTPEQLDQLKAYRSQEPPLSYEECALRLDTSLWSVRYNCKKYIEEDTDE